MRTPRVSIPAPCGPLEELELPSAEARHLVQVLRRGPGDSVILVPGTGDVLDAEIVRVDSNGGVTRVVVRVRGQAGSSAGESRVVPWTVGVGVPKGNALEQGLRSASELGLEAVVPLVTERTIVRQASCERKLDRWRKIAEESAKQCGRPRPLSVLQPVSFQGFVSSFATGAAEGETGWILDPTAPQALESLLGEVSGYRRAPGAGGLARATFLVGPEGGFTPQELVQARSAGFRCLGLSLPVLRTPTALSLLGALGALLLGCAGSGGAGLGRGDAPQADGFSR